jgi:aminopeptidase 2
MCSSRRGEASGSTNVQGREVLPTNVKPQHYDLTLEPNFEKFTYEGTVTIEYVKVKALGICMAANHAI